MTALVALFIALGGTSYAVTQLPRNSVGSKQIRRSAVTSRAIHDRSIAVRDISRTARASLRGAKGDAGPPGPSGVTYRAVLNSGGATVRGNAVTATHQGGSGLYTVAFDRDVSACVATATLSEAPNGSALETPPAGRITVGLDGPRVAVRTFDTDGSVKDLPFSVIVAC